MSFTIDVYYYGHGGDPAVPVPVRSAEELDRVLDFISTTAQPNPSVLVARERPRIGPRAKPDHHVKIDVDGAARLGAICFVGPHSDAPDGYDSAAWVTRTVEAVQDAPPIYLDKATRTEFPRDAVVPFALVREALHEFRETGERPTCVQWQLSDVY